MTEKEIRKAVSNGQGRAILFLLEAADQAYFPLVLELCSRDQAFDSLFENRRPYMCRLADTLPHPEALVQPLGERLFESRNKRDRMQVREILGHFRRKGNFEAREYLLKDFYRFRLKDRQFVDAVELLGFEGLELLVGQIHRLDDRRIESIYEESVEEFGKRRTLTVFRKLAKTNAEARRILAGKERERTAPKSREVDSAAVLIERLKRGEFVPSGSFLLSASKANWIELALLIMESTDDKVLRRAAPLISRHSWPLNVNAAIQQALAEPNDHRRRLRLKMLQSTKSESLRAWALEQLEGRIVIKEGGIAFELLRLNAQIGDYPVLTAALFKLRHYRESFHFAGIDLLWLKCGPTTQMLNLIFEYGPCHECRNSVVRELIKRRAFTAAMRKECAEDSCGDTQKLAKRHRPAQVQSESRRYRL